MWNRLQYHQCAAYKHLFNLPVELLVLMEAGRIGDAKSYRRTWTAVSLSCRWQRLWRTELRGGAEYMLTGQLFHFFVDGRGCGGQNLGVGMNMCYLDSCSTVLSMAEAVEDRTWRWG
jgi:hypothetical protein